MKIKLRTYAYGKEIKYATNNNTRQKEWDIALQLVKMYARGRYAKTLKVKVDYVPT